MIYAPLSLREVCFYTLSFMGTLPVGLLLSVEKTIHKPLSCAFGMFCWEILLQIAEAAEWLSVIQ